MKLDFEEVSVAGLAKSYGPTLALAGVDLNFDAGTVTVIQGSNGSGKSTLLWLLAMLAYPTRGEIRYGQYGITHADGLRGRIGFVAHQLQLYPGLSGHENLCSPPSCRTSPTQRNGPATSVKRSISASIGTAPSVPIPGVKRSVCRSPAPCSTSPACC